MSKTEDQYIDLDLDVYNIVGKMNERNEGALIYGRMSEDDKMTATVFGDASKLCALIGNMANDNHALEQVIIVGLVYKSCVDGFTRESEVDDKAKQIIDLLKGKI